MANKTMICAAMMLMLPIGAAYAVDHPPMKEGLWQIRTQTNEMPSNKKSDGTVKLCRDHDYDKATEALAKKRPGCTPISDSMAGGKYVYESRCTVGSTVIASKGTVVAQGDTAAHSETHVTYTPALYGNTDETMIQDQTYLGSCPAGMQPGDRMLQDGTIQHHRQH